MTRRIAQILAVAVIGVSSGAAKADVLLFSSDTNASHSYTGYGSYTGSLEVTNPLNTTSANVILTLTNTTASGGGFITAFALNSPRVGGNPGAGASLVSGSTLVSDGAHPAFSNIAFGLNGIGTIFGSFDWGAGIYTGGNPAVPVWHAGDSGSLTGAGGIGVGQTGVFQFTLALDETLAVSAASILGQVSDGTPESYTHTSALAVRFHGINHDGDYETNDLKTDKVPLGVVRNPPPGTTPVPAPPAVLLGVIGAMGLFGRRAWTRRKTAELAV